MADPLSSSALLKGMADALPTHEKEDEGSDLASSYEVVALLVHAYLAALGFRIYGFDEDKTTPDCEALAPRLPPQWNAGFGSLSFAYRHKQSSMSFVFRIDRMGTKVEIRGLAVGDERIHRFERKIRDVVDARNLPVRITMTPEGEEDRSDLVEQLRGTFISNAAIDSFIKDLKHQIVEKLIPFLRAEGYVDSQTESSSRTSSRPSPPAVPQMIIPPARGAYPAGLVPQPPVRPHPFARPVPDFPPPGFEDEHRTNQPLRGVFPDAEPPTAIGRDDLNPGFEHIPGRPFQGMYPSAGGHSGMYPTFNDPLFTQQGSGRGQGQGNLGYDPQVPPGARWDPIGPGGNPRMPGPGLDGEEEVASGPGFDGASRFGRLRPSPHGEDPTFRGFADDVLGLPRPGPENYGTGNGPGGSFDPFI